MTIASRFHAALAAFALVLAGTAAVAPTTAHAAPLTGKAVIAVAVFAAVTVATFALIDEDGDEDPQSP
jgi:hypothetical protein